MQHLPRPVDDDLPVRQGAGQALPDAHGSPPPPRLQSLPGGPQQQPGDSDTSDLSPLADGWRTRQAIRFVSYLLAHDISHPPMIPYHIQKRFLKFVYINIVVSRV